MLKINDFTEKLKLIYPNDFNEILTSHYLSKPKTFRINNAVHNKSEILKALGNEGYLIEETNVPGGYVVKNDRRLSDSNLLSEGKIYIQGLSSMLPAIVLNPKAGERVLDLCAAPGSKTTQIASLSNNEAEIVAVEENRNRFFKLKTVTEQQDAKVNCMLSDGVRLPFKHPEFINYFDKILVDAPCTSEAEMELNDPDALKFWRSSNASKLSKLQKGLLNSAVKMLKTEGTLVYSTCTYSVEENELVLDWILKRYPELKVEKIELPTRNIQQGRIEWRGKKLNEQIANAIRILPNEYFNGFFLAKLVK